MHKITLRKGSDRGHFNHGWLHAKHSFSFAEYHDPDFMSFGNLRVLNEDIISAGTGFGMHPHKNMEIITYIIDGSITHSDSIGNKEEIKTGEVQVMSAGKGVVHSEWNYSDKECHLFQMWIRPSYLGGEPYYKIYRPDHFEKWALIASESAMDGSVAIRQNASVFVINSGGLNKVSFPEFDNNLAWIHIMKGAVTIDNIELESGDAIGVDGDKSFLNKIIFREQSFVLLFYIQR